jgi:hypothetical protein
MLFEESERYGILAQALLRKESSASWKVIRKFIYISKIQNYASISMMN